MNTRLKTRSDYHVFSPTPAGFQSLGLHRCLKPLFWLMLGAVLGMSYNKKAVDTCYDRLAFVEAEKNTVVATTKTHAHARLQAPPDAHAVAKGKVSSSV